jgi:hypothetical protein
VEGDTLPGEDAVEGIGQHAGFEAVAAEYFELGEGDALDGEHLLGVHGAVAGNGIGFEFAEFVKVFEAHNAEGGSGEAVLDRVSGRAGFAFSGARTGGTLGVGSVSGESRARDRGGRLRVRAWL